MKTTERDERQDQWSGFLTTRRAILYTGESRSAIGRAMRNGDLVAAGRRGKSYVFSKEALDLWLCGGRPGVTRPDDARTLATVTPIATARRARLGPALMRARAAAGRTEP